MSARGSLLLIVLTLMTLAGVSSATVHGGTTARLLGTAHDGAWALLVEHPFQSDCSHDACTVYAIDTRASGFRRLFLAEVPARSDELEQELCFEDGKRRLARRECGMVVAQQLIDEAATLEPNEDGTQPFNQRLASRYLAELTVWQRARLGKLAPRPPPTRPESTHQNDESASSLRLHELGPQPLVLHLKERWEVPSFRAFTESGQACNPAKLDSCQTELRWVDGQRTQRWSCSPPPPESAAPDCAGSASMMRVEASWEGGATELGRSSLVEPGVIASYGVLNDPARRVAVSSLFMRRRALDVYHLSQAWLVVGAYGEGIQGNGTWFPLVVAIPTPPGVRQAAP